MNFIIEILLLSVAVFVVARLLPGVQLKSFGTGVIVAIVFSVLDFLCFKILVFLSLPLVGITFGLFIFVINAFLLWLTDMFVSGFKIRNFFITIVAAFLISAANVIMRAIFL